MTANANAGEVNGWIQRVEFYVNGTLTHTDTAGPWSFAMTNVPAGSYVLTAKAVDQLNAETTSAPITVTVGAASIHYIHTDHLNTPRVITNQAQQVVWRYDNTDPFGGNVPDENPSGLGTFSCNLRLPGQYFDKETNLHYNYFRDYDPAIGRYVQSDPIGLLGGINSYSYANSNSLLFVDPAGLQGDVLDGKGGRSPAPGFPDASAEARQRLVQQLTDLLRKVRDMLCEREKKPCGPCKLVDGTVVPVGTIAYRFDVLPDGKVQHGVSGSHLNLYKANQNPNNCQCFWQYINTVKPPPHADWIPIQPFAN